MHPELLDHSRSGRRAAHLDSSGVVSRPALWERLGAPTRATVLSAPAGSGKSVLLRSWIRGASLADRVAWISVGRGEKDPQRFWLTVLDELRRTGPGSALIRPLTAAPDLDGWAIVERLLTDLAPLQDQMWLIVDDLHELDSAPARQQLELLMLRAPASLRFVLATRRDVRLGLHRLRLDGGLTEIRAEDLRFSRSEAQKLFAKAGVRLASPTLEQLVKRTEGWAAGLRLAALSLAGHTDPERFAAEFSGSERTVADYLVAEVLDRQPERIRRLLLRTSVLDRVNGELADLLTGSLGGERVLRDLTEANAFVVPLDAARSWFRYHHLFADLLRLELRDTAPEEVPALHERAADWFAGHGFPAEAVRHAQAAGNWEQAARLLADHWTALYLGGQIMTVHALLTAFPPAMLTSDTELALVAASDELTQGSLETAEQYLEQAEQQSAAVPAARRGRTQVLLGMGRLQVAWTKGNFPDLPQHAQQLQALADAPSPSQPGLGDDLRALTLLSLGDSEIWTGQPDRAESHLRQGGMLARQIGRPHLEFRALTHRAEIDLSGNIPRAAERSRQAIDLAEEHGWTSEVPFGLACMTLGSALAWQGRLGEAGPWLQRAGRVTNAQAAPMSAMGVEYARGQFALGRGRADEALAAFRTVEQIAGRLATPHPLTRPLQAWIMHALVRQGDPGRAERVLADLSDRGRGRGEIRIAIAALRLAQRDPRTATEVLAPVLDGSARVGWRSWLAQAALLEGIAQDALGDQPAAGRALERALDVAGPDGALMWFLIHPAPGLLERQRRGRTAHAALISRILGLLTGNASSAPSATAPMAMLDPVSESEFRVLPYLPTHLSVPEIAAELSVSANTVKTHLRNLYAKLGAHRRTEAVEAARALGLLAPPAQRR
jgi:LuxR family maltose regulon positive regulatory protein